MSAYDREFESWDHANLAKVNRTHGFERCVNWESCGYKGIYGVPYSLDGECSECEKKSHPEQVETCDNCKVELFHSSAITRKWDYKPSLIPCDKGNLCLKCHINCYKERFLWCPFCESMLSPNDEYKELYTRDIATSYSMGGSGIIKFYNICYKWSCYNGFAYWMGKAFIPLFGDKIRPIIENIFSSMVAAHRFQGNRKVHSGYFKFFDKNGNGIKIDPKNIVHTITDNFDANDDAQKNIDVRKYIIETCKLNGIDLFGDYHILE